MEVADLVVLNYAISLAVAGQKQEAHAQLKALLPANPSDVNLLLWLAHTSAELQEAEFYLNQAATLSPDSPEVAAARQWLHSQKISQAVPVAAKATIPPTGGPTTSSGHYTFQVKIPRLGKPGGKLKFSPRNLALGGLVALLVVLGVLFVPNLLKPSPSSYRYYTDADTLLAESKIGDRVRFTSSLYVLRDNGDNDYNCFWYSKVDGSLGFIVHVPKEIKKPAVYSLSLPNGSRENYMNRGTYYVKITERKGKNLSGEVESIDF